MPRLLFALGEVPEQVLERLAAKGTYRHLHAWGGLGRLARRTLGSPCAGSEMVQASQQRPPRFVGKERKKDRNRMYIYIYLYYGTLWNSLDMAVTLTASEGVLALPVFLMHSLWMLFVPEPLASLFTSLHLFILSDCDFSGRHNYLQQTRRSTHQRGKDSIPDMGHACICIQQQLTDGIRMKQKGQASCPSN